jgi:hypothetical protein
MDEGQAAGRVLVSSNQLFEDQGSGVVTVVDEDDLAGGAHERRVETVDERPY